RLPGVLQLSQISAERPSIGIRQQYLTWRRTSGCWNAGGTSRSGRGAVEDGGLDQPGGRGPAGLHREVGRAQARLEAVAPRAWSLQFRVSYDCEPAYLGHAVATLAAFLASPVADNITGQALDVSAE